MESASQLEVEVLAVLRILGEAETVQLAPAESLIAYAAKCKASESCNMDSSFLLMLKDCQSSEGYLSTISMKLAT